jgi:uridine phosphorylase
MSKNIFKESELILNPDGSVYHLSLLPGQVAPLIIFVGDPERVHQVSRCFDTVEHRSSKREFVTHTGRLGNTRLSVLSTGIGPDNIDIVWNELDALFNIDLHQRSALPSPTRLRVIRLGTAGSLHPSAPADTLVSSVGAIGMDGLLQFYDAPDQQQHPLLEALRQRFAGRWHFPLQPYYAASAADLRARLLLPGMQQGYTATNPGFYGPQGRQLRARVRLPEYLDILQGFEYEGVPLINLEMETAAILGLAQLLGHEAISISAILANRPAGTFSTQPQATVQKMIESVLAQL